MIPPPALLSASASASASAAARPARRAIVPMLTSLLIAALGMALALPPAAAQSPQDLRRLPATYDSDLVSARVILTKTEYLVGEPIYFDIEFRNDSLVPRSVTFTPDFGADLQLIVQLPDEEPVLYKGLNRPNMGQRTNNLIMAGERRLFHFRVQFSDDPTRRTSSSSSRPKPS
jgi:hypothetical protein